MEAPAQDKKIDETGPNTLNQKSSSGERLLEKDNYNELKNSGHKSQKNALVVKANALEDKSISAIPLDQQTNSRYLLDKR